MSGSGPVPVDEIARRILASSPYRFAVAATDAERAAGYGLRADAVVAANWSEPIAGEQGIETDAFDRRAVHIVGWHGHEAVATGRLVPPPGLLPTEAACGLRVEPVGRVIDVGRMVVAPAHRGRRSGTFLALLAALYLEVRSRGFDVACGMMARDVRALVRLLGLQVEVLGPDRSHHGERRAPVRFELGANIDPLQERWREA